MLVIANYQDIVEVYGGPDNYNDGITSWRLLNDHACTIVLQINKAPKHITKNEVYRLSASVTPDAVYEDIVAKELQCVRAIYKNKTAQQLMGVINDYKKFGRSSK
jgi:hypothetical protein